MLRRMTPARLARENAGYSIEQAAKRARVTPRYLRRCERGYTPLRLAERLAHMYDCGLEAFFPQRQPVASGCGRE